MIRIQYVEKLTDEHVNRMVWQLLEQCDTEFVPPLSARESSYQANLNNPPSQLDVVSHKPYQYFEELKDQHCLLAFGESNQLVGFMSFRSPYTCNELRDHSPSNYVTTVIVAPTERNKGITRRLYQSMEQELPATLQLPFLTTRTWSHNDAHIHLLQDLQFETAAELLDHRGAGIHTLYFAKRVQ